MRSLKIVLLATVAAAAVSTATHAADAIVMTDVVPEPMYAAAGFDGPYAGLYVLGATNPGSVGIGVNLGVNFSADALLFGIEGDADWRTHGYDLQVHGKLGFMAGDNAAVYVFSGFGYNHNNGTYVPLGIGAEFGVADNMSIKASAEYDWSIAHGNDNVVGKLGVNFHF